LLVLVVAVTGTSPSITNPANWTLTNTSNNANIMCKVYIMPNNVGGITNVAVTIGGTGGGAVAILLELAGASNIVTQTTANGNNVGSAAFNTPAFPISQEAGQLALYAVAYAAATLTLTNSANLAQAATDVSTSGTPNAQLNVYWGNTVYFVRTLVTGTFDASVAHAQALFVLNILGSVVYTRANIGAGDVVVVGQSA
jgi:hypothetical protein